MHVGVAESDRSKWDFIAAQKTALLAVLLISDGMLFHKEGKLNCGNLAMRSVRDRGS